jgi:hypothetical protein
VTFTPGAMSTESTSAGNPDGSPSVTLTSSPGNRLGLSVVTVGPVVSSDIRYVITTGATIAKEGTFHEDGTNPVAVINYVKSAGGLTVWGSLTDLASGDYVVGVGIDRNSNGQLDTNEVTRRIGVHVAAVGDALYGGEVVHVAGNVGYDEHSLLLSGPDAMGETLYYAFLTGAAVDASVKSWEDIYNVLGSSWFPDASLSSIYLNGHGTGAGGVWLGGHQVNPPIPPHVAARINQKLRADGSLILGGCRVVTSAPLGALQKMANDIQHRVVGNTAGVWGSGEGEQLWIGYDPQ